jgi:hypothetical protein
MIGMVADDHQVLRSEGLFLVHDLGLEEGGYPPDP